MTTDNRDRLYIDIETYSATDLKKAGVYRYSEDADFEILMAAYADETDVMLGTVHVAIGEEAIRQIPGLFDPKVVKVAHNAAFERVCLSRLAGLPTGEYIDPAEYEDTMALAAEWGYPRSLEALAKVLGAEEKDSAGTLLINTFCSPRKGVRTMPEDKPEKWEAFVEYCRQDVATLIDIHERLLERHGGWPTEHERKVWITDQKINDRGIPTDTTMAAQAVAADEENREAQLAEMIELTGVDNPRSLPQLTEWFASTGLELENLRAETVRDLLAGDSLTETQRRVLELRQDTALAAAGKYKAALSHVSEDGRLRGAFQFFGAHTGRWAGRGVQLQNLPAAALTSPEIQKAKAAGVPKAELAELIAAHVDAAILDLDLGFGADAQTLKALVRAMFVGPFTVVDYSAIEARVIAWLAGEQWALDAFSAGRDIYVETAGRMFNLSESEAIERRKDGKVAVLALGYNGGVNSLRIMGAQGSDEKLKGMVNQWRGANQNIVGFWEELEEAFRKGKGATAGEHIRVESEGRTRYIVLPSGRSISYHQCGSKTEMGPYGPLKKISFADLSKPGFRIGTYGGKLAENVTQAVARDILAHALVRLASNGYELVGHVHDEILVNGVGKHSVPTVSGLMTDNPSWAAGLPLAAEGEQMRRYRK